MDVEKEKELRARLEEGVELKKKLPHKYYKRRLYYEIFVHFPKKNHFLVVVERKNINPEEKTIKLRIVEIFQIVSGERLKIDSSLLYAQMVLEPVQKVYFSKNQYDLAGKLYLPTKSETR